MIRDHSPLADEWPLLPLSEMRRLLIKHRGPNPRTLKGSKKVWEKSTTLCLHDIHLLTNLHRNILTRIVRGETDFKFSGKLRRLSFGLRRRRMLSRILVLIEAGRITKRQHGDYTIHRDPVVAPAPPRLQVRLGVNGPSLVPLQTLRPPPRLPDFAAVFKGR